MTRVTYALRTGLGLAAAVLLASCTSDRSARMGRAAPAASSVRTPAPAAAQLTGAARATEDIWHLRAGLNVAALSCRGRGRAAVDGGYRAMLLRHRQLFAAAYRGEERRYGQAGLDRHQTQLYNRFAYQRDPVRFCAVAAGVARQAGGMDSRRFAHDAPRMLAELDRTRH